MSKLDLLIEPSGVVRMIYDDSIDLRSIGNPIIRRGSHVEPTHDGRWNADLSPTDGPLLGPFDTRRQALAAEVAWLRKHWLLPNRQ